MQEIHFIFHSGIWKYICRKKWAHSEGGFHKTKATSQFTYFLSPYSSKETKTIWNILKMSDLMGIQN